MIPKIIHQTWKSEKIPEKWKDGVDSCHKIHKGYRYILWTHQMMTKFVRKYYPEFYPTYRDYMHDIQRCDAFRYLVLYKYGGIYLDLDLVCKKKLDEFLHYDLVLARSPNLPGAYINAFYMSIPKHPFLKFCIDKLSKYKDHSVSYFGNRSHIFHSTGPFFLKEMIHHYGKISNFYILNRSEFSGDCRLCNMEECEGGKYFKQTVGRSWFQWDSHLYTFGTCHSTEILMSILMATLIGTEYYYFSSSLIDKRTPPIIE